MGEAGRSEDRSGTEIHGRCDLTNVEGRNEYDKSDRLHGRDDQVGCSGRCLSVRTDEREWRSTGHFETYTEIMACKCTKILWVERICVPSVNKYVPIKCLGFRRL